MAHYLPPLSLIWKMVAAKQSGPNNSTGFATVKLGANKTVTTTDVTKTNHGKWRLVEEESIAVVCITASDHLQWLTSSYLHPQPLIVVLELGSGTSIGLVPITPTLYQSPLSTASGHAPRAYHNSRMWQPTPPSF